MRTGRQQQRAKLNTISWRHPYRLYDRSSALTHICQFDDWFECLSVAACMWTRSCIYACRRHAINLIKRLCSMTSFEWIILRLSVRLNELRETCFLSIPITQSNRFCVWFWIHSSGCPLSIAIAKYIIRSSLETLSYQRRRKHFIITY